MKAVSKPLAADFYTSPEIHEAEHLSIFSKAWFLCTPLSRIRSPYDAVAVAIQNKPLIAWNCGKECRVFYNVCRHRGGNLLYEEQCNTRNLRCKYHGWTYDQDGRLIAAPRFDQNNAAEVLQAGISLRQPKVLQRSGLVFVNFGDDPLTSSDFADSIESNFPSIDRFEFAEIRTFNFRCNWKLYVENWLESYHLPWLHKNLSKDVNVDSYTISIHDWGVVHAAKASSASSVYAGRWGWHWPAFAWNTYGDGISLEQIIPLGIRSTEVRYTFLFALGTPSEGKRSSLDMCVQVTQEDGQMCEVVQRAIDAGVYVPGPLSPLHETAIGAFHKRYRSALNI